DRELVNVREVRRGQGQLYVALGDRRHPVPAFSHQPSNSRKRHLPTQRQHQSLEQQREAAELSRPRRLDQPHRAIGQLHARHSYLEKAFVLKEVQVPIALRLRVVRGMLARDLRMGEAAPGPEVYVNGQRTSGGIEPCLTYIP